MNELNQHKKSDKIKFIFTGIAFVLMFVMLASVCLQVFGNGKVKPSEWGKKPDIEQTQSTTDNIVISPIESRGIELCSATVPTAEYANYGIDARTVENVFELSVTYTPTNTTFQSTNYTIAFKNPNSAWATGKVVTDYADLQHENGSKNAVLTVKKSFQEQIIVKAISERDNTKSATFTVDYLCTDVSIDLTSYRFACDEDIYVTPCRWIGGTLAPESDGHVYVVFAIWGASQISAKSGLSVNEYVVYSLDEETLSGSSSVSYIALILRNAGNYYNLSADQKKAYDNALGELYADYMDGDGILGYAFCYDRVYNGVNYGGTYPDDFSTWDIEWVDLEGSGFSEAFEVNANSLTPNNPHIVVG